MPDTPHSTRILPLHAAFWISHQLERNVIHGSGGLRRLDVLLIDELGYLTLKPEQSNIFFNLMEKRYHRHSTIITTNLRHDEWGNFLGNPTMVDALLSRVRHYCHTIRIDEPSLRDPQG